MYVNLKVASSEMEQAKRGLMRKLFIKGRGTEILPEISPAPHPLSAF